MLNQQTESMLKSHKILCEFNFRVVELDRGYANRTLRIDLDKNEITEVPVTQQMKDLWVGGKGFDLWMMFQEIDKNTKWDSNNNPLCFAAGPLGGTTSFPGAGKTIVTTISPITEIIIDSNVGGYFGPFLKFAGSIRGFGGSELNDRVDQTITKCHLVKVRDQTISTLSKGYRQRTCFAQAILHDPRVLIMDEPTDGLDPNQKFVVREMIKEMASEKVIIVSTHILEEVDAVCNRAIIIANGQVAANGTPNELKAMSSTGRLEDVFRKLTLEEDA